MLWNAGLECCAPEVYFVIAAFVCKELEDTQLWQEMVKLPRAEEMFALRDQYHPVLWQWFALWAQCEELSWRKNAAISLLYP
jgi:hypothetical protein